MNRRRTKKGNRWEDHYTRQARKEKQPARSVYKLKEIQAKFRLIRKKDRVLDLGCAPGSWMLYAAELVGAEGLVVGVDMQPVTINLPSQARSVTADGLDAGNPAAEFLQTGYQVVMSDMAPSTTGNKLVDAARSVELCRAALDVALSCLAPGGAFVCKIFQGEDFKAFADEVRSCFHSMSIFKPQSCRKASEEIFIIGKGFSAGI